MADNDSLAKEHAASSTDAPGVMEETREELEVRHRKELKALDGEKRAALKKTKATAGKGKKGKDLLQR
jgi:hypothetical protein